MFAGTYGPAEGGSLCLMCPTNFTNSADGSAACPVPSTPGEMSLHIFCFGLATHSIV